MLKSTVLINFTLVGLFGFNLLLHADIYSLYRGKIYVCARFCSIHFTVILAGLKKIFRYTEDFVI